IARLKAELAETLIAHFCYPRFFDYLTESLRSRPVDRSKRQEVWLYLSSFDFTAWSRVDLMSADFQHYIERLFIHFVQRNRSFFGEQGRKRLSDIRMLINTSALSVVQGLRAHLMGQHQHKPPFGSPRPVISWSTTATSGRPEPTWEQISSSTMLLQQQLQEVRGEIKAAPAPQPEARPAAATPAKRDIVQSPAPSASSQVQSRELPQPMPTTPAQRESATNLVGEEDVAIFEQLRYQLIVWLRIEAIRSGLEVANQTPSHLLEILRQQDNRNETSLQVVSTLLNLSNQVIKNGKASIFDYKQA